MAEEKPVARLESRTAETYLGYHRTKGFNSSEGPVLNEYTDYSTTLIPENGQWTLNGNWAFTQEYIVSSESGVLELGFNAKNVFLVIEPGDEGGTIEVEVDGLISEDTDDVKNGLLQVNESRLYQLVELKDPGTHVLKLRVKGKLRLFAFTFG